MIVIDLGILQIIYSVVIPILVGIFTKQDANPTVKSLGLVALTVIGTLADQALNGGGMITEQMLTTGLTTFVIAVASYYGVWKPTGVAEKVQEKTATKGIG